MFPNTRQSSCGLNIYDSTDIIDSCPGCGRPHTAHPIAKINKVKDLALILLTGVFSVFNLHLLSKSILSNRFTILFTHSLPYNKDIHPQ